MTMRLGGTQRQALLASLVVSAMEPGPFPAKPHGCEALLCSHSDCALEHLQPAGCGWRLESWLPQLDGVYRSDFLVPIFESMELTITDIRCKYF